MAALGKACVGFSGAALKKKLLGYLPSFTLIGTNFSMCIGVANYAWRHLAFEFDSYACGTFLGPPIAHQLAI
ncbi:MAG: hypothetical protein JKY99_01650 [Rhizobiales bacterium]|nr:hypothetical protein [Hyphomicrobiales bacterium]